MTKLTQKYKDRLAEAVKRQIFKQLDIEAKELGLIKDEK